MTFAPSGDPLQKELKQLEFLKKQARKWANEGNRIMTESYVKQIREMYPNDMPGPIKGFVGGIKATLAKKEGAAEALWEIRITVPARMSTADNPHNRFDVVCRVMAAGRESAVQHICRGLGITDLPSDVALHAIRDPDRQPVNPDIENA